ncbi:hypothetical protein [Noviherbaspirillum saxi]|uniref:hypothetical protein n=1 Tax=Noviherbaspirillum saxi TaxID=2320863 RepID=UPI00131441B9|nr:hypothetical protein [Noviherbaspirillum saxi]
MAKTANNKYPADKTGTKYSEFRNTKRVPPGKPRVERNTKQADTGADQAADKKSK